jgi:hypothetical protein
MGSGQISMLFTKVFGTSLLWLLGFRESLTRFRREENSNDIVLSWHL